MDCLHAVLLWTNHELYTKCCQVMRIDELFMDCLQVSHNARAFGSVNGL